MTLVFLLQLSVILATSRLVGRAFSAFGQPQVIGEILAGIALGPSLLGWLAPSWHHALFPETSLTLLNLVGQIGLVLFMFTVGLTLDLDHVRENYARALAISLSCIAVPFVLGAMLASLWHERLAGPQASVPVFALFIGVCMSITAFPVLARILRDTGLAETRLGTIAISCAAVDDVCAWLILAGILGFIRAPQQQRSLALTFVLLAGYLVMMGAARFVLRRPVLSSALLFALLSSYATEWIGVHALFGAFFAGVVMRKTPELVSEISQAVEPVSTSLLLPVFFALTGLRTNFSLALAGDFWMYTLAVIVAAVAGKWLAALAVGRWMGMSSRDANALGILMNTRGLVELVILNIGFELGVLSPTVFSMMVLMAFVTTFMTAPLLRRCKI